MFVNHVWLIIVDPVKKTWTNFLYFNVYLVQQKREKKRSVGLMYLVYKIQTFIIPFFRTIPVSLGY